MFTRTIIARLARSAHRVLDRNAGNQPARMLAALLASLAMGSVGLADDLSPGVVRVSDHPPASSQTASANGGPVLQLTGNPAVDGWRSNQFALEVNAVTPVSAPAPAAAPPAAAPVPGVATDASCSVCDPNAALGYGGARGCNGCDNCRHGLLGSCCLFQCCHCGWRFLDAHCYCMTYAVSPWYCDPRDGRVYSAYGWGAPMTVPLAPTVTNQYNYGWGIPSGRLTPISRVASRPGALTAAVAPY
jgi:hypothetical protein